VQRDIAVQRDSAKCRPDHQRSEFHMDWLRRFGAIYWGRAFLNQRFRGMNMDPKEHIVDLAFKYENATLAILIALESGRVEAQREACERWAEAVAAMHALPLEDRFHGERFLAAWVRAADWKRILTTLEDFAAESRARKDK
jgi:hypothetical protein